MTMVMTRVKHLSVLYSATSIMRAAKVSTSMWPGWSSTEKD